MVFYAGNHRFQILRRLSTGDLQFETEQNEIVNFKDNEVISRWCSGEWQVDEESLGTLGDVIYLATAADLSIYPEKHQQLAKYRLAYIKAVDPENNKFNVERWRILIQNHAQTIYDKKPPHAKSVRNWWVRYRTTQSITTLLPQRSRQRVRTDNRAYQLFEEVINEVYLNKQKFPVKEVYERLKIRIHVLNVNLPEEQKIRVLARSTIYRWVNELRQDIVDASRLGAKVTRAKYRAVMSNLKVCQVLERIEIDHTPLDLIVTDKNTMLPLGRPWVTIAIDRYSRMVAGYYISFNAPSSYAVLQCIKMMILDKSSLLKRFPDIKNEWPVFGIPDLLALDNGMDLHSDALSKSCLELGIEMLFCPAGTPEMKGAVERYFRTMNQGLIHQLPGTVFSNIGERGDYPAEKLAAIDMETLVHLVTKWIVDVYNVSYHRGLKDVPMHVWQSSIKTRMVDLPVYPTQLDVITGIPAKRTVFHYGIELEGLHYNNSALQDVRRISGKNLKVDLKFYEDQIQYVDIFDPFQKQYIRVESTLLEYTKSLHREQHRLARAQARKRFGEQFNHDHLLEAKAEIQNIIKGALKDKKMAKRKLSATVIKHDSVSVFENKNPLKAVHAKANLTMQKPPEKLDDGLDDELPDLTKSSSVNQKKNDQGDQ